MALEEKISKLLKEADFLLENQEIDRVMNVLSIATHFSQTSEEYYEIGKRYSDTSRAEEAVSMFSNAITLNPKNYEYWDALAGEYYRMENYDQVISTLEKAINLNPQNPILLTRLGLTYNILKRFEEACTSLEKAIQIDASNYYTWNFLAITKHQKGDSKGATDAFKQTLKINPSDPVVWYNLGISSASIGLFNETIFALENAIQIDPNYEEAVIHLANAYLEINQNSKAIQTFKKALSINPQNAETWRLLGLAYIDEKMFSDSIETLTYSLQLKPNNFVAWQNLGVAYTDIDSKKAIDAYKKSVELAPDTEECWHTLITEYFRSNMFKEAEIAISQGIKSCIKKDLLLFDDSKLRAINNDIEQAVSIANKINNSSVKSAAHATIYMHSGTTLPCIEYAFDTMTLVKNTLPKEREYPSELILRKIKSTIEYSIQNHIARYGFDDLIRTLKENFRDKLSLNLGWMLGALLSATGDDSEYIKTSQELFRDILKENPHALIPEYYDSRNSIETISLNCISENLYIIKTSTEGSQKLLEEFQKTRFIHDIHKKTTQALFLEQNFLVEKRIIAPTLAEIEKGADDSTLNLEILNCIDTLINLYGSVKPEKISDKNYQIEHIDSITNEKYLINLPKYDFASELERRLLSRNPGKSKSFLEEYKRIMSEITFEEQFIHTDAHTKNWIKGGILIDWESPGVGDPLIDLVTLIDDSEFKDLNKEEFLDYYVNKSYMDKTQLNNRYKFIRMHNSLCQLGSKRKIGDEQKEEQYLEAAIEFVSAYPNLEEEFYSYLLSSKIIS